MPSDKLQEAISSIDWAGNVASFLELEDLKKDFATGNYLLAIWSKQLEQIDKGNPALSFIREMQLAGQQAVALTALALYKPAAASIRAALEAALYYVYFRTHIVELNTLHRDNSFWISKSDILHYLKIHAPNYKELQSKLNFAANLEGNYKHLSSIIHGQLPGVWSHKTFKKTAITLSTAKEVQKSFTEAVQVIHKLFLCTIAQEYWDDISTDAKKILLKGIPGTEKALLGLDAK